MPQHLQPRLPRLRILRRPDAGPSPENTRQPRQQAQPQPANDATEPAPPPKPAITTLAPGQKPSGTPAPQEQLFTLSRQLNFVQVPVTVKDDAGHLVERPVTSEFHRAGERSAAEHCVFHQRSRSRSRRRLIVDVDLPNTALDHVKQTFGALVGAFSEFDELAVYTYSNIVRSQQDFLGALSEKTAVTLELACARWKDCPRDRPINDNPMTIGPERQWPSVSRYRPQPCPASENRAYPESAVLNDAILRASADLGHRDPTRRRILFIISDGREKGSTASYDDVKKVLLTNNITVFAVGARYRSHSSLRQTGEDPPAAPGIWQYPAEIRFRYRGRGFGRVDPLRHRERILAADRRGSQPVHHSGTTATRQRIPWRIAASISG